MLIKKTHATIRKEREKMVEIIIINNQTKIKTEDLQINIEGGFEIKKEGDNAPTIKMVSV